MSEVRTRFAPSPTGYMHIGNLRTALYSYLLAKSKGGSFILRIEDTDQKRYVDGAVDVIHNVLKDCGIVWDEGDDVGGNFGPYTQSERVKSGIYLKYAKELIEKGHAYYCFCKDCHSDLLRYSEDVNYGHNERSNTFVGYNGHCRNLSQEEIEKNLKEGKPFVIRQKLEKNIDVTYHDEVFGDITINSNDLDDQVLIKQDGFPTYNFANVIDDHLMEITHVVRGCEYLSSTPKYNLLYQAFGWDIPKYVHLPLIMGETNGVVSKLSKRDGAVTFDEFVKQGYTNESIINYIALLGWTPNGNQEFFSMEEMKKLFNVKKINKSPAIFDYKKLDWINGKYIRKTSDDKFLDYAKQFTVFNETKYNQYYNEVILSLKNKLNKYTDIDNILKPIYEYDVNYDLNYLIVDKIQADYNTAIDSLNYFKDYYQSLILSFKEKNYDFNNDKSFWENIPHKKSVFMTALRVAMTGESFSMLDPILMLKVLDKDSILYRIENSIERISNQVLNKG